MRQLALQTLTWGTVVAAVASAFWLAATEPGWTEWRNPFNDSESFFDRETEPEGQRAPPPHEGNGGRRGEAPGHPRT